ncbi:TetR/AcrR family transcriptional regulator [Nocardia bovistercoris]|uniref:TetR/AcrR family transcriptional regulator n=1 Tax=Nocardia bovistercoris TaxID=2785916 RepID=A0A931N0Z4_9NOCA|nr:TetR/AcrR family transcriptional regulator [Nocardia bovistercoris]MBH0775162.1 TetR/AcrR family transcriptional regulator [Nocardia bovistercoris]
MESVTVRADARSNRDQILAAALIAFREKGIDVPMKEIADLAGVGVGTLYRHFPDRDAVLTAIAHPYLADLAARAATARAEEPTAWTALARFLHECAQARLGALAAALEPTLHTCIRNNPELTEIRAAVVDHLTAMTDAAHAEGTLRTDVGTADIANLMTVQIYARAGENTAEATRRVVDLILDGLRTAPG